MPADELLTKPEPSFQQLVLVEPAVYWRVFSLDYQAEQFEVFHRRAITRWTHYVGTQVIVWAYLQLTFGWRIGSLPVAVLVAAAAAQNVSHSVEPVPPVLTGRGFEPFPMYWSQASSAHRVRLLLLNTFYLPLELVSAPRLFPVHVMRAMHRLGWRPAQAADVQARATAILGSA